MRTYTKEEWKVINNASQYLISNKGRVFSLKRGIILCQFDNNGYKKVSYFDNDHKHVCKYVHRLVAEHFIENKKRLLEVNHIDENRTNNCVNNLEWCSHSYNVNYGKRTEKARETFKKNNSNTKYKIAKINEDGECVAVYNSLSEIERLLGYAHQTISKRIYDGKKMYGYFWKPVNRQEAVNY